MPLVVGSLHVLDVRRVWYRGVAGAESTPVRTYPPGQIPTYLPCTHPIPPYLYVLIYRPVPTLPTHLHVPTYQCLIPTLYLPTYLPCTHPT